MFDYQLLKVEKKIKNLCNRGFFDKRHIFLFGVSDNTRQTITLLRACNLEPEAVLDNDSRKQGTFCSGLPVIALEAVKNAWDPENMFVICSAYWSEMSAQLRETGVMQKNILVLSEKESFLGCFYQAAIGKRIYQRLTKIYGDVPVFVCPYTGTGDVYLIGTFWKQYIEKNRVHDYVFLVISKACEKIARLFDIKNVVIFQRKVECVWLLRYYMLCPDKVRLVVLNDSWKQLHTDPLEGLRGYKGLEFTQLFRKFVFDLSDTVHPLHPHLEKSYQKSKKTFRELGLREGRTVILSPYSNTLADLPGSFWIRLSEKLMRAGFLVCTNSGGESEPAVDGTKLVCFSLDLAPGIVESAGYFIGIRSGLCDVISGTDARKVILYHARERFFHCSTYEYFSLRRMELCDDAVEITFEQGDDDLIGKVVEAVMLNTKQEKEKTNITRRQKQS
ncbi:hypothetical protein D5274_04105 [bacterium 1XD42-94]|nr:hypothetical protein [bacterium 1XD42-76]NBK04362.1 hypothetical protein [bacterium 1XD42-94]